MGLTAGSTGRHAAVFESDIKKEHTGDAVIALAGNPNVGKSTVFNALTGMHQHTGNWPGKTVGSAQGTYTYKSKSYTLVDIPGAYSLMAHSAEEEIARDFICFGESDAVVIVCDATCLMRNLNLVLQTIEITPNVIVCVNLMDEAAKKNICVDCKALSDALGVPVAATAARQKSGLDHLTEEIKAMTDAPRKRTAQKPVYRDAIEAAVAKIEPTIAAVTQKVNPRWAALRLLDADSSLFTSMEQYLGTPLHENEAVKEAVRSAKTDLAEAGLTEASLRDAIVADLYGRAEEICKQSVHCSDANYNQKQLAADRLLTGRLVGIPLMLVLLLCVLWLTIYGANYPSELLSNLLFGLEEPLARTLSGFLPKGVVHLLVWGVYRVLAWVVSVMLPPMAIFFPLFTLLEDAGYLPRVAFNLDAGFKKCCACGKQALTMCMGFGCNAAGVIGCRIIDSPRERMIAVLTNNFVPCNGRFPMLISIITMFFIAGTGSITASLVSAAMLTAVILLGVMMTFAVSWLLSKTLLKGLPSSFTLELPAYRRPQIGQVIIRSVFDRTLFVLGRAVTVAAPAGLIIYVMANCTVGNVTLLAHCASFLDPFARCIGIDGVILMAFILGFPANEIVIPIVIMAYMSTGTLTELGSLENLRTLLVNNGWTWLTAACTMLFSLMHWPCSTTLLSIKKETGSWRWTAVGFLLPTLSGIVICFLLTSIVRLLGLV